MDLLYGSPETLSSKQWSKQLKEDLLGKQTVCLVVDEAHSVSQFVLVFNAGRFNL